MTRPASTRAAVRRANALAALALVLALGIGLFAVAMYERARESQRQRELAQAAMAHAVLVQQLVDRTLSATYALAAALRQNPADIPGIGRLADELLPLYPGVDNLQLAPGGIVRHVFPSDRREGPLGHDLLNDLEERPEAWLTIRQRDLHIAIPSRLKQGGTGLVGRYPVFLPDTRGQPAFWGFVSAVVFSDTLLSAAQFDRLEQHGLAYHLWRLHPITGDVQTLARSAAPTGDGAASSDIGVPRGLWRLSVSPREAPPAWGMARLLGLLLAVLFALAVAAIVRHMLMRPVELAHLVLRRTGELEQANAQLQQEMATRQQVGEALRLQQSAVQAATCGILIVEKAGPLFLIRHMNPTMERLTGHALRELEGQPFVRLLALDTEDQELQLARFREVAARGQAESSTLQLRRRDAVPLWCDFSMAPIHGAAGTVTHYVGLFIDITERRLFEQELRRQATHDSLTGLGNRALLEHQLHQAIAASRRAGGQVAVLLLDLDDFKNINDSLGHRAGDAMLQEVAKALSRSVRQADSVYRLGGDEFVIVLTEITDADTVGAVARKILDEVARPHCIQGREFHVTTSLGVAMCPQDGQDTESLLSLADVAMYRAKQDGRNRLAFFSQALDSSAKMRLQLVDDLREAIRTEAFELHHQVKVDIASGVPVGTEALLRWRHPVRGLVSPAEFIQLAEETGLIVAMGDWALRKACLQARARADAGGRPLTVAVNLSARQFRDEALVKKVALALAQSGLPAEHLELEITESMMMHKPEQAAATMHALRQLGVSLAVDDFGTGYSSLGYLSRFPIQCLKIDRSFVQKVPGSPADTTIARSVISLGKSLGMTVVAEGVETLEQLEFLRHHGCDVAQGYLLGRPEPVA